MKSKKSQEAESLLPLSSLEDTDSEQSLRHKEESEASELLPQESRANTWHAGFRSFFRRYWQITLLFSVTWLAGAFSICSRLQESMQLRIMEQFSSFRLAAEFPFSFQDPEKLQAGRQLALEQIPPVFDLKESKPGRIRASFRLRIQVLLSLPAESLQAQHLVELRAIFSNENAVNLFFRSLDEILEIGLIEVGALPPLPTRDEGNREVIIYTDEHQILRDYSSLLTIDEAYSKLEEDFGKRIGNRKLDLTFFRESELFEPTLEYNEDKSDKLRAETLASLDLPSEQFKAGDQLIELSPRELALLDAYLAAGKQRHLSGHGAFTLEFNRSNLARLFLLTLFIVSYLFCLTRIRITPTNLHQCLIACAVGLILHFVLTFAVFYLYSISDWPLAYLFCLLPLALIPSLLANLLGGRVAICTAVVISALLPLQISTVHLQYQIFHYSLFIALVGVAFFQHAKRRRDFIIGGFAVGFAIMLSQVFFAFEQKNIFGSFIDILPEVLLFSYTNGFLVALLCMGLLPVFETCFGLITLTTLLELNDSNHPLLQRLRQEAPGTFQHSMSVATIAESAANAIQANALLTRVMALFHDIGKIENPGYFAENMRSGSNPHDQLPASESCRIIVSHVQDGLNLAQKYRLRRSISSAIEQHHGNSLQTYFYEKARKEAKEAQQAAPDKSQFRYPHPPPLQKEIVIVSLADACEAAVRSLSSGSHDHSRLLQNANELLRPGSSSFGEEQEQRLREFLLRLEKENEEGLTSENVERMINKIFDDKWSDNQFAEANITTSELEAIRQSILRTCMDMFHFRPQYPRREAEPEENP